LPAVLHHQAARHGAGLVRQPAGGRGHGWAPRLPNRAGTGVDVHPPDPRPRARAGAPPRGGRPPARGRGWGRGGGMSPSALRRSPFNTAAGPAEDAGDRADLPPGRGARVLIVDDEEVLAATLQEYLQDEGYEVAVAHDAAAALDLAGRFEPDVAL